MTQTCSRLRIHIPVTMVTVTCVIAINFLLNLYHVYLVLIKVLSLTIALCHLYGVNPVGTTLVSIIRSKQVTNVYFLSKHINKLINTSMLLEKWGSSEKYTCKCVHRTMQKCHFFLELYHVFTHTPPCLVV